MGRRDDPIWTEFTAIRCKAPPAKLHPDVACNYCDEVFTNAQPSRHLYPHIQVCSRAPTTTKKRWAEYASQKKRKASQAEFRSPLKSRRTSYGDAVRTPPTKGDVSKAEGGSFHLDIAKAFFTSGVPFRVIENPHMRACLTRYRPAMKLPTRQTLATSLLDAVYTMEKKKLALLLSRQTFLVVITDGWSNINRESVVNYVIWAPSMRPMMWSSGTTGAEAHTGDFMASEISRIIAEVESVAGIGKVSAVVSDNAANMKKAGRLVEVEHPNVVFNGCSAHAMNLLLKDIFKIELFADVLKNAVKLVSFVRARHLLLDRVRSLRRNLSRREKAGELSTPVSTRWYAQEKCIKSVIRNKKSLMAAFADSNVMESYNDKESLRKLVEVRTILQDKRFWSKAKLVLRLTKPITRALAIFETDACSNSMILNEFIRLFQAPEYAPSDASSARTSVQNDIRKLIASRWNFIRPPSDSTTIAYILDPSKDISILPRRTLANETLEELPDCGLSTELVGIQRDDNVESYGGSPIDQPLRRAVASAVKLAERFGLPPDVTPARFRSELLAFVKMKKNWTAEQGEEASLDTPLEWWTFDTSFPVLHNFAEKMLSIPTSPAASERLWSVHGFTHSKFRNRLKVETVEKLSFIYTNNGDARPTQSPLYKTPPATPDAAIDSDADSDSDQDNEDDDCMFNLREREFDYLLDAIVSVDISN